MKKRNIIEDIIYQLIIVIMIGVPSIKLLSYCMYLMGKVKDTFVINQVYLLWFAIPLLIILYVLQIVISKRKIDDFDILMYVLIFLGILSTIFSVDINKSIFGEECRFEGILSLASYYLIFMNVKNIKTEEYKKNIIKIFFIIGIVQVVYALLQVFTQAKFIFHVSRPHMGMGLCGNPNFFGSYMVMLSLISVTLYLLKKEKKYFALAIIYFIGLVLCNSTGPFISYIISLIFLLIFFNKRIDKMKFLVLFTVLTVVYFSTDLSVKYVHNKIFHNQIDTAYTISNELGNSINSYRSGELGNGRLRIWKNSLDLVDDYFILGSGPDTFADITHKMKLVFMIKLTMYIYRCF